jgi:hypothetical protein
MSDPTRGERLQIMPSRAAAVRELLKRGLEAEGFDVARQGSKSQDFGVIDEEESKKA